MDGTEVSRGSWQTTEAWAGQCLSTRGRYRMNRWYSSDGSHGQPLREGERDSPGRHVDLMETKVLSDSRCVYLVCVLGWVVFFQEA